MSDKLMHQALIKVTKADNGYIVKNGKSTTVVVTASDLVKVIMAALDTTLITMSPGSSILVDMKIWDTKTENL